MKRAEFLEKSGCPLELFCALRRRGQLPFELAPGQADFTIGQAERMSLVYRLSRAGLPAPRAADLVLRSEGGARRVLAILEGDNGTC